MIVSAFEYNLENIVDMRHLFIFSQKNNTLTSHFQRVEQVCALILTESIHEVGLRHKMTSLHVLARIWFLWSLWIKLCSFFLSAPSISGPKLVNLFSCLIGKVQLFTLIPRFKVTTYINK